MFGFLKKDPVKQLEERHLKKLEEAMLAQRNGDIRGFAMLSEEAEGMKKELEALKAQA